MKVAKLYGDGRLEIGGEAVEYPDGLYGGRNLIFNSGGEYLTLPSSSYSPQLVDINGERAVTFNNNRDILNINWASSQGLTLEQGQEYTFSFYAMGDRIMSSRMVYLNNMNSNFLQNQQFTTNWVRYHFTFTARDSGGVNMHMYPTKTNEDGTFDGFYLTKFKLEKGSRLTPWTPAPEDLNITYPDEIQDFNPKLHNEGSIDISEIIEYPREIQGGRNILLNSALRTDNGLFIRNQNVTLSNPTNEYLRVYSNQSSSTPGIIIRNFEVDDCDYTISFDARGIGGTSTIRISLRGANASGSIVQDDFRRISVTLKPAFSQDYLLFYISNNQVGQGFEIRDVKIEKGSESTPWTPAPEDLGYIYSDKIHRFYPGIQNNGAMLVEELKEGYMEDITTDGLVLWLDGDDFTNNPQTTMWVDRSGMGNHAIASGFAYTQASGSDGFGGVNLDGADDYFRIPNHPSLEPTEATIEFRFTPRSFTSYPSIICKRTANTTGYFVFLTGGTLSFDWGGNGKRWATGHTLTLNQEVTVALTSDSSGRKLYINGILSKSTTSIGDPNLVPCDSDIFISRNAIASDYFVNGNFKYIRMYNRALSGEEILKNYNASG
jgi:hypothetical protein